MTEPSPAAGSSRLALDSLAGLDPNVTGATGGSGTRVVGRVVRAAGMYIGTNLNESEDALDFGDYSDRWINRFMSGGSLDGLSDDLRAEMVEDLALVMQEHRSDLPADAAAWGWKEPRSIYLLPFYDSVMPAMRFLHWIRDGRDMAFSVNQQQLVKHSGSVLSPDETGWKKPVRSIALWARVNGLAADFGEHRMAGRYLRLRFEDLCSDPVGTIRRIYDFFGLEGDAELAGAQVRRPDTLGRWQRSRPWRRRAHEKMVARLHEVAGPALERFGYLAAD
jgi:hypothetical protein